MGEEVRRDGLPNRAERSRDLRPAVPPLLARISLRAKTYAGAGSPRADSTSRVKLDLDCNTRRRLPSQAAVRSGRGSSQAFRSLGDNDELFSSFLQNASLTLAARQAQSETQTETQAQVTGSQVTGSPVTGNEERGRIGRRRQRPVSTERALPASPSRLPQVPPPRASLTARASSTARTTHDLLSGCGRFEGRGIEGGRSIQDLRNGGLRGADAHAAKTREMKVGGAWPPPPHAAGAGAANSYPIRQPLHPISHEPRMSQSTRASPETRAAFEQRAARNSRRETLQSMALFSSRLQQPRGTGCRLALSSLAPSSAVPSHRRIKSSVFSSGGDSVLSSTLVSMESSLRDENPLQRANLFEETAHRRARSNAPGPFIRSADTHTRTHTQTHTHTPAQIHTPSHMNTLGHIKPSSRMNTVSPRTTASHSLNHRLAQSCTNAGAHKSGVPSRLLGASLLGDSLLRDNDDCSAGGDFIDNNDDGFNDDWEGVNELPDVRDRIRAGESGSSGAPGDDEDCWQFLPLPGTPSHASDSPTSGDKENEEMHNQKKQNQGKKMPGKQAHSPNRTPSTAATKRHLGGCPGPDSSDVGVFREHDDDSQKSDSINSAANYSGDGDNKLDLAEQALLQALAILSTA